MTVLEILNWATQSLEGFEEGRGRLHAELLLAHALGLGREQLYTEFHRPVSKEEQTAYERLIRRRMSGEPLQYILGRQEFWSIPLKVTPAVLIPRPETELLVEAAISILAPLSSGHQARLLELGTGSGAVAIAVAKELGQVFVVATDRSKEALSVARDNARSAAVDERIAWICGDLFRPLRIPNGEDAFDLVLSNPPYVVRSEIPTLAREVKDHEPRIALDGGEDGLDFYRWILADAPLFLRPGGWLLLEMGQGQAEKISKMLGRTGSFRDPEMIRDLAGTERVVKAQKVGLKAERATVSEDELRTGD